MKKVDVNGRVNVPKYMWNALGLNVGDDIDVRLEANSIVITNPKQQVIKTEVITNLKLLNDKYHDPMLYATLQKMMKL